MTSPRRASMGRPAPAPAPADKYPGLAVDCSDDDVPLAELKRSSGLVRLLQTERARHDAQLAFNAIGAYVSYRTGQDRVLLDAALGRIEATMPEHAEAFTAVRAYFSLGSSPPQAQKTQRTTFRVPARINAHKPSSWMRIPSASRRVPSGSRSSSSSSAYSSASSTSRQSPPPKTRPSPPPQPVLPAPPPSAHTRTPRTCPQAMTAAQRIAAAWRPPPPPAYSRVDPNPVSGSVVRAVRA